LGRAGTRASEVTPGSDTYYGRHIFYRIQGGQIYVITVPPLVVSAPSATASSTLTTIRR
jgi:hypothetical protein